MIPVKDAVNRAFDHFGELYGRRRFEDVILEEVALSEDRSRWLVTIGFSRQAPSVNIMESIGSKKYMRSFKQLEIDAETGEMVAMKNRGLSEQY
jgi:hypothetical protein